MDSAWDRERGSVQKRVKSRRRMQGMVNRVEKKGVGEKIRASAEVSHKLGGRVEEEWRRVRRGEFGG